MFSIAEIAKIFGKSEYIDEQTRIKRVCIDSRKVKKGDLYIAIKGANFDGNDYLKQAYKKGAVCIIASKKATRFILAFLKSASRLGHPRPSLRSHS